MKKEKSECKLKIVGDDNSVSVCKYHDGQTIIRSYHIVGMLNGNYELRYDFKSYSLEGNSFGLDEYYEESGIGKTF